jgi:hypothetical protein
MAMMAVATLLTTSDATITIFQLCINQVVTAVTTMSCKAIVCSNILLDIVLLIELCYI